MKILDKTIKFEKTQSGLYKIFVSDKEKEESIPLLIEDHQITVFEEMMKELKFKEEVSFSYFKNIVSGCAKIAMRDLTTVL